MNSEALADKIQYLMEKPVILTLQSKRNIEIAHDYAPEVLQNKRIEFYTYIKKLATQRDEKDN